MWAQAAILLCLSIHIGYAVTGHVTINDEQVLTDSTTGRDYGAVGYHHYYAGERVQISCSKDSTTSLSPELIYGKGHERHACKKADDEGSDASPSLSVTLTEASDRAYAECVTDAPAPEGASERSLRSRVYFVRKQLPHAGALYFRVNGVPLIPAPGRDGDAPRTHHGLEFGYYTGEQLDVTSFKDADTYGPMECVLTGEDIPSELDDLKIPRVLDRVNFVARLQKQRVSLDCRVQVKTADARPRRNIHISLYLKPLGDFVNVKELPYSCRIPTFFLDPTQTTTVVVTATVTDTATAVARANAIVTATSTATATAPATSIATSSSTAGTTCTSTARATAGVTSTADSTSTATTTSTSTATATVT
uniref:Thr-rich antifreeze protein isoform FL\|nr:Thr-rich antifreeze protein isoform FL\